MRIVIKVSGYLALVLVGQSWRDEINLKVEGYRPSNLPNFLKDIPVVETIPGGNCYRGYRSIGSRFVVHMSIDDVVKELSKHEEVRVNKVPLNGPSAEIVSVSFHKYLPDRYFSVRAEPGRQVIRNMGRTRLIEMEDKDSYSTVHVGERPLFSGPSPAKWPKEARKVMALPKRVQFPPLNEIKGPPTYYRLDIASAGIGYEMTWFVKGPIDEATAKLGADLKAAGKWTVSPQPLDRMRQPKGFRARPFPDPREDRTNRGESPPGLMEISLLEFTDPDAPPGTCRLTARWWDGSISWNLKHGGG